MTAELKRDPAIERWAAMREQTHYYFRMNRSKVIPLTVLLGIIPAAIVYGSFLGYVPANAPRQSLRHPIL